MSHSYELFRLSISNSFRTGGLRPRPFPTTSKVAGLFPAMNDKLAESLKPRRGLVIYGHRESYIR
ncbi:hypothetical protein BDZ97DRAFT_1791903 [Flammula alnicola]|nr:hypothetical protein BDZ97DRAFT_1791903 [Flammula alnicola]